MSLRKIKNVETDKYVLFLTSEFSQWYPAGFVNDEGKSFSSAEQFMMYNKATLFGDFETAEKILKAETPKEQKTLGREVKGFDLDVWNAHAPEIVFQGNLLKYKQNPHLFDVLMATKGKEIAEAADYDPIWGIGLRADDPLAADKANWQGSNWLGNVHMRVRDTLEAEGFTPKRTEENSPVFTFYDAKGQRNLYISVKEYARQQGFTESKITEDGVLLSPNERAVESLRMLFNYKSTGLLLSSRDDGSPLDYHFKADIKGYGEILNTYEDFMERNRAVLQRFPTYQERVNKISMG